MLEIVQDYDKQSLMLTAILNTNSPMFTLQQTLLSPPTIHVVQPSGSSPSAMCVESLGSEKSELSTSNLH